MPTTLIIVAAVAILIILLATASYKVCPADRVMVITGPGGRRFVSGGSAFIIPFIMRVDWLSLGAVQSLLRTDTPIPTKDAILIDVNAVANFQIASETMTVDENGKQVKALEKRRQELSEPVKGAHGEGRDPSAPRQAARGHRQDRVEGTHGEQGHVRRDRGRIRPRGHGTAWPSIDHVQHSRLHRPSERHRQHGR